MRVAIACAIMLHAASAVAEPTPIASEQVRAPTRTIVGIGIGGAAMWNAEWSVPWYIEVAHQPVARIPVSAFAMFKRGRWSSGENQDFGSGEWWQVAVGAEYRECAGRGHACFFLDGAIGGMQVSASEPYEPPWLPKFPQTATTLSGRVGFDTGWRYVRFRIAWDFSEPVTHSFYSIDHQTSTFETVNLGVPSGLEIGLAAAF
jgi:hypothetical protein